MKDGSGSQRERERASVYEVLCLLMEDVDPRPRLEHDDNGAPYLPDHPDLWVSISHCRTAVAVALSTDGRVGIDVECRRKIGDRLMERVSTEEEFAAVRAAEDTVMAFLQLWTRKEAVLKMRGTGIQSFGSMVHALDDENVVVEDLHCDLPDVVASLAR